MYAFRVTVTAVELFQKIQQQKAKTIAQMLQGDKNGNIKYNIIQAIQVLLLCGWTPHYSSQKHTKYGNLYLKLRKYTVPK